jgi:DnaJ-class molecular chaperone
MTCPTCKGECIVDCEKCNGTGSVPGDLLSLFHPVTCPYCNGDRKKKCINCRGKGYIED